jgi:hypothetical protein
MPIDGRSGTLAPWNGPSLLSEDGQCQRRNRGFVALHGNLPSLPHLSLSRLTMSDIGRSGAAPQNRY